MHSKQCFVVGLEIASLSRYSSDNELVIIWVTANVCFQRNWGHPKGFLSNERQDRGRIDSRMSVGKFNKHSFVLLLENLIWTTARTVIYAS